MSRCLSLFVLATSMLALPAGAAMTCSGSNVAVPFGNYDVLDPNPTDTQSDFLVTCSRNGGPANVTLTVSLGPSGVSGTISPRQLRRTGGTERLAYNLYREASRSTVWGQTVGVDTVAHTLNVPNNGSNTVGFNIYGRIAAQQDLRIGSYADSLVVTVSY